MIVIFIFLCANPCRKNWCYITAHNACGVTPTGQCDVYRRGAMHLAVGIKVVYIHVVSGLTHIYVYVS